MGSLFDVPFGARLGERRRGRRWPRARHLCGLREAKVGSSIVAHC